MKKEANPELPIQILKIGTCPTLSAQSELTYHLGRHEDESIYLQIIKNTGNGQFNLDWVPLVKIEKLLTEHLSDKPMYSSVMRPIYQGKSSNSPAFLFAVLKAEGMVIARKEKDGGYLLGDIDSFKNMACKLKVNTPDTQPNAKPSPRKKAEN